MRFKKFIATAVIAAGILGGSGAALAQATANTSASGSATIIRPITISKTADLQFGRVVLPSTGSATVTIANTADSISTGTAVALSGITTSRGKSKQVKMRLFKSLGRATGGYGVFHVVKNEQVTGLVEPAESISMPETPEAAEE